MVVHLVNNSKRTIYVARRSVPVNGRFNGYDRWHVTRRYDIEGPDETDHWNNNERLVFSFREITEHDASPTLFSDMKFAGPWRNRETGTWTYIFSASGWSCHEGPPLPEELPDYKPTTQGDPSKVPSSAAGSGWPSTHGRGLGMPFFAMEFTPVMTSCRSTCFPSPARTWYVVLYHGIYSHNILQANLLSLMGTDVVCRSLPWNLQS